MLSRWNYFRIGDGTQSQEAPSNNSRERNFHRSMQATSYCGSSLIMFKEQRWNCCRPDVYRPVMMSALVLPVVSDSCLLRRFGFGVARRAPCSVKAIFQGKDLKQKFYTQTPCPEHIVPEVKWWKHANAPSRYSPLTLGRMSPHITDPAFF